jgi:hypothetical protein
VGGGAARWEVYVPLARALPANLGVDAVDPIHRSPCWRTVGRPVLFEATATPEP